ncbi:hypothetical protein GNF18_10275 [Ligilactobacillus pobuzihii]|uniref:hypothetical protein n=1 Tax=Ligilactobacillus pobuzihii TaxID=449659 RepID=UPI0019D09769|nr:hypothetical protein [Ligilactobacillus pobuzihii]MBN7275526.1 hypothetical protein [Ligilactobacillus pobuzihii]
MDKTRQRIRKVSSELAVYIDLHFPLVDGVAQQKVQINKDPFVIRKRDELRELNFYDGIERVANGVTTLKTTTGDLADLIRAGLKLRELASVLNMSPSHVILNIKRDQTLQTLWDTRKALRAEIVCKFDDGPIKRFKSVNKCSEVLGVSPSAISGYLAKKRQPHGFQIWHEMDYLKMLEEKYNKQKMVGDQSV